MKKFTAVVAVAAVAGGNATQGFAQEAAVQLYGTLNVDVENVHTAGAAPAAALVAGQLGITPTGINVVARNRVTQNSANLGFRGSEPLGGGLKAFFQIESAVAVDVGGSALASRNSAVGMEGDFGSVRIGQWDTPYKTLSGAVDPMYFTGIAYSGAVIGTPGFGVGPVTAATIATSADGRAYANTANASFERRQGNVIQYWTPAISGFLFKLAYAANEGRTVASPTVTGVNPTVLSLSGEFSFGPLFVGYSHERHSDLFGLSALVPAAQAVPVSTTVPAPAITSHDSGDKIAARYSFGDTQLGILWERLKYEQSSTAAIVGAFNEYDRHAVMATLVQKIGDRGSIRALSGVAQSGSCGRAGGAACDAGGLGARQVSLGYSYTFSKRTDLYWFYTRVANDARASYQFANSAGLGAASGSANIGYVFGIRHTF